MRRGFRNARPLEARFGPRDCEKSIRTEKFARMDPGGREHESIPRFLDSSGPRHPLCPIPMHRRRSPRGEEGGRRAGGRGKERGAEEPSWFMVVVIAHHGPYLLGLLPESSSAMARRSLCWCCGGGHHLDARRLAKHYRTVLHTNISYNGEPGPQPRGRPTFSKPPPPGPVFSSQRSSPYMEQMRNAHSTTLQ